MEAMGRNAGGRERSHTLLTVRCPVELYTSHLNTSTFTRMRVISGALTSLRLERCVHDPDDPPRRLTCSTFSKGVVFIV